MKSPILISAGVITAAIVFIGLQLSNFSIDSSLGTWKNNAAGFRAALAEQADSGKPVAVFFYTDWCQNCKALRENILSSQEFKEYSSRLIPVKINPESGADERKIADKYGVFGYPTFLILAPESHKASYVSTRRNLTTGQFIGECQKAEKS